MRRCARLCGATRGEVYQEFPVWLAKESGIATPTREQLAKLDRKRAGKGSNEEWKRWANECTRRSAGGGRRQGLSHRRHTAGATGGRSSDLHFRARSRCWKD